MAVAQAISEDGKRRIRPVLLDGHPKYYVESRGRNGWIFDGQYRTIEEVARVVDLSTFTIG